MKNKNCNEIPCTKLILTVAYVGFGGNTGKYFEYFHAFSKNNITVPDTKTDSNILVQIEHEDPERFKVYSFAVSNNKVIYSYYKTLSDNKITFYSKNGKPYISSNFVVMVKDMVRGAIFYADPQVINSPPPPPP